MTSEPAEQVDENQRSSPRIAYFPLVVCVAIYLISPYLIAVAMPASVAGWGVVGLFVFTALATGMWFGAVTKPTWWYPVSVGVAFMVATVMYFPEGGVLYAVGFAVLAGLATLLTGAKKLDLDEDGAQQRTDDQSNGAHQPKVVSDGNLEA